MQLCEKRYILYGWYVGYNRIQEKSWQSRDFSFSETIIPSNDKFFFFPTICQDLRGKTLSPHYICKWYTWLVCEWNRCNKNSFVFPNKCVPPGLVPWIATMTKSQQKQFRPLGWVSVRTSDFYIIQSLRGYKEKKQAEVRIIRFSAELLLYILLKSFN